MKLRGLLVITAAFCATVELYAAAIRVPGDRPTIQAGIDAATNGDTVLIADGTYRGDGNRDIVFSEATITVRSEHGAETCVVDCEADCTEGNDHFGFLFQLGNGPNTLLQGLTITHACKAHGLFISEGAIQCRGSSPTIKDCILTGNSSFDGGGINCSASSPLVQGCIISDNVSRHNGGGVYCYSAAPTFVECTISRNTTLGEHSGGGIYCENANAIIVNCKITDNHSDHGGGIYVCVQSATIAYCTISGNIAIGGGGISCGSSSPSVSNCIISSNIADLGGGVLTAEGSFPQFINCTVVANQAYSDAGGMYFSHDSSPSLVNCTITGNTAGKFGGGLAMGSTASAAIINSIMADNSTNASQGNELALFYHASLSIAYSDLKSCPNQTYLGPDAQVNWGAGIIYDDPQFVDGPDGPYYLSQVAAGQSSDSPCKDAGNELALNVCYNAAMWLLDDSLLQRWSCISEQTTRTDQVDDEGTADIGCHNHAIATPTPMPQPSPTPNPTPDLKLGVELHLSQEVFRPGNAFFLSAEIHNPAANPAFQPRFAVVLDAYGSLFWYPDWTHDITTVPIDLTIDPTTVKILEFNWPNEHTSASGLCFYAALVDQNLTTICGYYGSACFGWAP